MELATSVIRDLFTKEVDKVHIDSKKLYKEIIQYLKWASPALVKKVELYDKKKSIFDSFEVQKELETTHKRKVDLQSGGSIVIDQTEAMTVIDVNSGRSISEKQQEKTAFKTNLEALKEIARQIRLRDISGIIIIDFIDIKLESNKKKLFSDMKREISRDRAKTVVYPLTQLCLMQITRQRINQNISEKTSESCPMCHGSGRIASKAVLLNSIERWLKNFRLKSKEFRLILYVHPHVAAYLAEGKISKLSRLMIKYFVKIKIQQSEHVHIDQFSFHSVRKQKDVTADYA
jgi:ribonuclease G